MAGHTDQDPDLDQARAQTQAAGRSRADDKARARASRRLLRPLFSGACLPLRWRAANANKHPPDEPPPRPAAIVSLSACSAPAPAPARSQPVRVATAPALVPPPASATRRHRELDNRRPSSTSTSTSTTATSTSTIPTPTSSTTPPAPELSSPPPLPPPSPQKQSQQPVGARSATPPPTTVLPRLPSSDKLIAKAASSESEFRPATPPHPPAPPPSDRDTASGSSSALPVIDVVALAAPPSLPVPKTSFLPGPVHPGPVSVSVSVPISTTTTTTSHTASTAGTTMAERSLAQILAQLKATPSPPYPEASALLSKAKLLLLQLQAVTPSPAAPPSVLRLARETLEQGAVVSIRAKNPEAFTRYVQQLQPFYELPSAVLVPDLPERNRVTGLYLLLLLTQGRYAEFHSELEALASREGGGTAGDVEGDRYLGYPIQLERWLMEGSYDRVWKAMKSREIPCEEYGIFSEILTVQIRNEIASSSERAYPSLPLSSTKALLFLDSEGAVVEFAAQRGWLVRDGHIYFPDADAADAGLEDGTQEKEVSQMVIENALGYARELETIV